MKEDDLPSNPSNDSNSDKADDADSIENDSSDKDTNPETNSIKDSINPDSAPTDVNNDSNIDDDEVVLGEPLSNSTRKSDDEQDDSDVDDYITDVDDQPHISSPTRKTAIVPDISGSSLPSLSGSLPSNNFFDQMMTEYDTIKMSSLTRNWGWENLSMKLRGCYFFIRVVRIEILSKKKKEDSPWKKNTWRSIKGNVSKKYWANVFSRICENILEIKKACFS